MKLIYLLALALLFFYFYFNGYAIAEWITGILILLIVLAKLFSGVIGVGKAGAKEFTRGMESDMEKASGKEPSKQYLTEIIKEAGTQSGQALAPQDYTYKQKDLIGNLTQGSKNFFEGINALFEGKAPHHDEKPKAEHKPKKPVHKSHPKKEPDSHSHGH